MRTTQLTMALTTLATTCFAMPTPQTSQAGPGEPYECHCSGRKAQLENLGADAFDLAVAFQETGSVLSGTAYPYGDTKTSDGANFGLFKNNWFMIRTYCSQFQGQTPDEYNNGAVLNTDDAAAIKCQHEQIQALGQQKWLSGQRGGPSGLNGQYGDIVQQYVNGITFIEGYLNQGHLTDDMTTYYIVPGV